MLSTAQTEVLFRAALAHHQAGRWQEAEAAYRRVLAVAPGHVPALRNLSALAFRFGALDAAAQLLGHAISAQPDAAELHDDLGQVRAAGGAMEDAVQCFERALALQPGFAQARAHLVAARGELALARDADYADTPGTPWAAGDSVYEERHGADTLLVTFAGLGVGRSPPTFIFRKFLARYRDVDKLFVRDLSMSWYLCGLPGIAADVPETARFFSGKVRGYRRTVFLGCSAGGMAALLYGQQVGADKVLAFAPQTTLADNKLTDCHDERWEQRLALLRREPALASYLDLAALNPFQIAVDVYYPGGSAHDSAHAARIAGRSVTRLPQPGDSHLLALQMRDNGTLRPIIEREIGFSAGAEPTAG